MGQLDMCTEVLHVAHIEILQVLRVCHVQNIRDHVTVAHNVDMVPRRVASPKIPIVRKMLILTNSDAEARRIPVSVFSPSTRAHEA